MESILPLDNIPATYPRPACVIYFADSVPLQIQEPKGAVKYMGCEDSTISSQAFF